MDTQAVCLTTKDITGFCERMKGIEDKISILCDQMKEVKDGFEKQRVDFAVYRSDMGDVVSRMGAKLETQIENIEKNTDEKIGEVPSGKTVMSCFRENENRINKIYWFAGLVPVLWVGALWILENLSKIYLFFKAN
jgi:hypothetical protein